MVLRNDSVAGKFALSSSIERVREYRRLAERLRRLSKIAKYQEAQQDFSRVALLYDRLADNPAEQLAKDKDSNEADTESRSSRSASPDDG